MNRLPFQGGQQQLPRPPSIGSRSNHQERSPSHNILKGCSSLSQVNPQQSYEVFHRIYKRDPEAWKRLLKEHNISVPERRSAQSHASSGGKDEPGNEAPVA